MSGNEAGFIPQDGLLFRQAVTQGWAQTEVLILGSEEVGHGICHDVIIDFVLGDIEQLNITYICDTLVRPY